MRGSKLNYRRCPLDPGEHEEAKCEFFNSGSNQFTEREQTGSKPDYVKSFWPIEPMTLSNFYTNGAQGLNQGAAVTWTDLTGRVVRCGESQWHFPHKPPNGGEPTMRKGSYSEELVKNNLKTRGDEDYPG